MRKRKFNEVEAAEGAAYLLLTDKSGNVAAKAAVDLEDLAALQELGMRWYLSKAPNAPPYATYRAWVDGKYRPVMLHRHLMSAGPGTIVDHINGDSLDNRRSNLRFVTGSQNSQNKKTPSNSKTGVKNVCWDKTRQKYRVYLKANGRNRNYGYFDTLDEAAAVARQARLDHHTHCPENSGRSVD